LLYLLKTSGKTCLFEYVFLPFYDNKKNSSWIEKTIMNNN